MDNLEEQLRNSRRKERPDLRPPAGGWEAVQAGLAASAAAAATGAAAGKAALATKAGAGTAAAGAATAAGATAAKASLATLVIKAVIGVTVIGGVVVGGYAITTTDWAGEDAAATTISHEAPAGQTAAPDLLPTEVPASTVTAASETAEHSGKTHSSGETTPPVQRMVAPGPQSGQTTSRNRVGQSASSPSAGAVTTGNGPTTQPSGSSPATENDQPAAGSPINGVAPANAAPRPTILDFNAPQSADPAVAPAAPPVRPAAADTSTRLPGFATFDEVGEGPIVTDLYTGEPVFESPTPTTTITEVAPVAIATINIPARAIPVPGTEYVPFALEAEVVPEEVRFGNFRRAEWSAWQIHGGATALIGRRQFTFGTNNVFRRTTSNNATQQITLETGEVVNLTSGINFLNSDVFSRNVAYRLGITRQTTWGGTIRATLNHYRANLEERDSPRTLAEDEVVIRTSEAERATFLDLEFQYTFFRRRRLRPFVGLGTILASTYNYRETETFFDAQSGTGGTNAVRERSNSFSTNPDMTVSAGLQFQVSRRLSVGAQLWGNFGASELYLDAPFGLEARYTLK